MESVAVHSRQESNKFKKRFFVVVFVLIAVFAVGLFSALRSGTKISELPAKIGGKDLDFSSVRWLTDSKFVYSVDGEVMEYDLKGKNHKSYPIERQVSPSLPSRAGISTTVRPASYVVFSNATSASNFSPDGKYLLEDGWLALKAMPTIYERKNDRYVRVKDGQAGYSFIGWKDNDTLLLVNAKTVPPAKKQGYPTVIGQVNEWKWRTDDKPVVLGTTSTWSPGRVTPQGTLLFESGAVLVEYSLNPFKEIRKVKLPMPKHIGSGGMVVGGSRTIYFSTGTGGRVMVAPMASSVGGPVGMFRTGNSVGISPDGKLACTVDREQRPSVLRKFVAKIGSLNYTDEVWVLKVTDLKTNKSREIATFPAASSPEATFLQWPLKDCIHVAIGDKHQLVTLPK